jgi:DNA-binding transcriptional ArsR family regulator
MIAKKSTQNPCCTPKGKGCCDPKTAAATPCCPAKPALQDRPLLTQEQAGGLAGIFKVLANDTRLRLLHALHRAEELCVTELAKAVGMKPQAVSNQLQRLSDLGILSCKRSGNTIRYRVADSCVTSLLDQGLCLMEDAWKPWQGHSVRQERSPVV